MENYNIKVREIIENWVKVSKELEIDFNTIAVSHILNIYNSNEDDNYFKFIVGYLLEVAYLDAYKMYSYRQKECVHDDLDEDIFGILNDIESFNDLYEVASNDQKFLEKILYSSYEFSNLTYLGKSMIMKSLSESENEFLTNLFPVHQQDVDIYNKQVDISTIVSYIGEKDFYQRLIMGVEFKGGIIANVLGYVRNLMKLDYKNAISILLEIGKVDYATSKYILENANLGEDKYLFMDHVNLYEDYNTFEIIARMMNDQDFLKDAIWNLADSYVYNSYEDLELTPKLIESEEAEKIAKKLILNNV